MDTLAAVGITVIAGFYLLRTQWAEWQGLASPCGCGKVCPKSKGIMTSPLTQINLGKPPSN